MHRSKHDEEVLDRTGAQFISKDGSLAVYWRDFFKSLKPENES